MTKQEKKQIELLVKSLEKINEIDDNLNYLYDERLELNKTIDEIKAALNIEGKK